MQIRKAERKAVKVKLAITGTSGSGKTMSALLLAKGIAGDKKILVIDTENGSSNLYADHQITKGIGYDVLELEAPFLASKYIAAIDLGIKEGYEVIIVDSITHEWDGQGGILDQKTALDSRGGNSFTNWAKFTPEHNKFVSALTQANCHLIATMRSKTEIVVEQNDKGRATPKKVGMKAVQRDGMEYEFTTIFDLAQNHTFQVTKDRTGQFMGRIEMITEKTGEEIGKWLNSGAPLTEEPKAAAFDAAELHRGIISIHANKDMLAAVEYWTERSAEEKSALKKLMTPAEAAWLKQAWENRPKD